MQGMVGEGVSGYWALEKGRGKKVREWEGDGR